MSCPALIDWSEVFNCIILIRFIFLLSLIIFVST